MIVEKKYEITNETVYLALPNGGTKMLYQIRAIRDFGDVKAGTLGGYIQDELNLAHEGNCWIEEGAIVYGDSTICENAVVKTGAVVADSVVCGCAVLTSRIYGTRVE